MSASSWESLTSNDASTLSFILSIFYGIGSAWQPFTVKSGRSVWVPLSHYSISEEEDDDED